MIIIVFLPPKNTIVSMYGQNRVFSIEWSSGGGGVYPAHEVSETITK